MEGNIVGAQMDLHLTNIQRETKAALTRFKESGLTLGAGFIKYFLKLSIESMTQTCERFEKEWDLLNKHVQTPKNMGIGSGSSSANNRQLGMSNVDVSNSVKGSKRRYETDGGDRDDMEQSKKQKSMLFKFDAIDNASQQKATVFFCDYCIDPKDSSKSFSGTADEVQKHWLSSHLNAIDSIAQPLQYGATETQQKSSVFFCDYCIDPNDSNKFFSGTVDEVYDHWLSTHLNESISQPFQFHAVDLARCFHCGEVGTYHDLVEHHKTQHTDKFFTISDRLNSKKCGICHFKDGNLIEHFKSSHESVSPPKIFNPVFYAEESVTEMLNINAEKEHRCIECSETFETHADIYKHFAVLHAGIESNPFIGGQSNPAYLICGFCAKIIDVKQYLTHFKKHSYKFSCSKCPYRSSDLAELVFHERKVHSIDTLDYHCSIFPDWLRNKNLNTKMVFKNGLVLKNYNVLGTKFDDSKLFNVFIEGILDAKKECLEQMMKMDPNPNINEILKQPLADQDALNQTATADDDSTHIAELNKQRFLENNLYVSGIKTVKSLGLQNIFLTLCQKLEVNVSDSDIKRIDEKYTNAMSVELHRLELKEMILNRVKTQPIWSNELLQLSKGEKPQKISIRSEMTPFYSEMYKMAFALQESKAIHSYKMGKDGFTVKRTPTDAAEIVRSKQELLDYSNGKETTA